jgi:hypothetical protein
MGKQDRSEYQAAIRLVRSTLDWKFAHDYVVSPVRKRVPLPSVGFNKLSRVLSYLEKQARADFMKQST